MSTMHVEKRLIINKLHMCHISTRSIQIHVQIVNINFTSKTILPRSSIYAEGTQLPLPNT